MELIATVEAARSEEYDKSLTKWRDQAYAVAANLRFTTADQRRIRRPAASRRPKERQLAIAMDDKLKEHLMPAVVVFNFTVAAYIGVKAVYPMLVSGRIMSYGTFFTHLLVGAAIGLVTGGVTLAVMMRK